MTSTQSLFCSVLHALRHQASHRRGGLLLHRHGRVGVGAQREARVVMPEHPRYRRDVHAVLERQRCERVPIGYNCDNTDKSSIFKGLRIFKCSFSIIKSLPIPDEQSKHGEVFDLSLSKGGCLLHGKIRNVQRSALVLLAVEHL